MNYEIWDVCSFLRTRSPMYRLARVALGIFALSAGATAAEAAPSAATPIFRAQIRLTVCDEREADTDARSQDVTVRLNRRNTTTLNRGGPDFERGSVRTYDLNLTGVRKFEDIDYLQIYKTGRNSVCFSDVRLLLNQKTVFSYPSADPAAPWIEWVRGSTDIWLDDRQGRELVHSFARSRLESNRIWDSYSFNPLTDIPRQIWESEIESRIEALTATFFHRGGFGIPVRWGSGERSVEVTRRLSRNSMRVEMDLRAKVPVIKDPRIDVDFDLAFSCTNDTLSIRPENVRVRTDVKRVKRRIAERRFQLSAKERKAEADIEAMAFETKVPFCPPIRVYQPGDVYVSLVPPAPLF